MLLERTILITSELVQAAEDTIRAGYYRAGGHLRPAPSLVDAISHGRSDHDPCVIVSVSPPRPTRGRPIEGGHAALMGRALDEGAVAFWVTTEPRFHGGSLSLLRRAVETRAPSVMRDVIVSEAQIDCAAAMGASGVVLNPSYVQARRLGHLVEYARMAGRDAVVECTLEEDLSAALKAAPDVIALPTRLALIPGIARIARGADPKRIVVCVGDPTERSEILRLCGLVDAVVTGPSLVEGCASVQGLLGGG